MVEKIKALGATWLIYLRAMAKWLGVAAVTGLLCGEVGTAFHVGVEAVTALRGAHPWLLYTLPALGLLVVLCYKGFCVEGVGTDNILEEVHSGRGVSPALIPAIFFSTLLTHLGGGSVGREGAALQMGGTVGYRTGRLLRLDDSDLRTATTVGMSAFFAALFGTPMAAAVFALEPAMLLRVALLATLGAFVSVLFCETMHIAQKQAAKRLPNPWLRVAAGGAVIAALTLLLGTTDYNGAGMPVVARAVEQGQAAPAAFALKLLFTAITLGVGYKGGEVVPSFFVGATFGCVVGPLLGIPAGFGAAIGLIAVFCGAVNCPLASTFLALELFGADGMLYFALTCALSFVLSGYSGIYSSQRILYDKLKAQYINVKANSRSANQNKEDRT